MPMMKKFPKSYKGKWRVLQFVLQGKLGVLNSKLISIDNFTILKIFLV